MRNIDEIKDALAENYNEEMLFADGFEDALVGVVSRCGMSPVAVYSTSKCIQILIEDGMDEEEAIEYFNFNVIGAYVGESTPMFIETLDEALPFLCE